MRICVVNGRNAMFHCWEQVSEVVAPSPMRDGHQGGTLRYTVGIVEYENGRIEKVAPKNIIFKDTQKLMAKAVKEFEKWEAKQVPVNQHQLVHLAPEIA